MMHVYDKDFTENFNTLEGIILNKEIIDLGNSNKKISIILQYIMLYYQYYRAVINLIKNNVCSSIYPIAKSTAECFSTIYGMIANYNDDILFKEKEIEEYMANINQIYKIQKNIIDATSKTQLQSRIVNQLKYIKAISGNETQKQIERICKSYRNNIADKVLNAFQNIDGYSGDVESFSNLYPELCLYSHNNIDGLMERFYENIDGKTVFSLLKEDKNIIPIKYMFFTSSNYIISWLKKVINEQEI